MTHILFRLFMILPILLTVSCSYDKTKLPDLDIGDGGLLSGNPCFAPCFWNITPGITTEEEAITILSRRGQFNKCEKWDKDENGVDKGRECSNLWLTFNDNGLVSRISFATAQDVTVGDIINIYGNPDEVSVTAYGIESEGPLLMSLHYDYEHMIIRLPVQNSAYYNLQQSTVIDSILYCEEDVYKRFISVLNEPWKGYGEY